MDRHIQIQLSQVTVIPIYFGEGRQLSPILRDVNLTINSGEWVALVGRNGSGKSTLAKAAGGWKLNGMKGSRSGVAAQAAGGKPVPIVMQRPDAALIGATPWEDIVLLLEQNEHAADSIIATAESALVRAGLGERMHQPLETLSGGQKQLVAIAGCLAMRSPLLVMDEVTAMLDPEASSQVIQQVRTLQKSGVAVLWITQRLEELEGGERLVVMDAGSIVFDGLTEHWYSRLNGAAGSSGCEQLGFYAPYAVQVAWELERQGVCLSPLPCTPEALAEVVNGYER